jgi:predicted GNAT superfamily acetyltransferase
MGTVSARPLIDSDHAIAWSLNQSEAPHVAEETWEEFQRLCRISVSRWALNASGGFAGFLLGMTAEAPYDSPNFLWFRERYRTGFLYVDRLAVAAAHRKSGGGAALYASAEADARRLGLKVLCCEVNLRPPNPVSHRFHERVGFTQAGQQEAEGKRVSMLVKPVRE